MRRGSDPESAARVAILRILKYYPDFFGAVIAVSKDGLHGAACNGMEVFPYILANDELGTATLQTYECNNTLPSSGSYKRFCFVSLIVYVVLLFVTR